MSSTAYATPLRLDLKPSWILFWILTFAHLGAAALMAVSGLTGWASGVLALSVLASYLWLQTRYALLRHPLAVQSVTWGRGDEWQVRTRNGKDILARLAPDSFVRPWLAVLLLRPRSGGALRRVVILPDTLDAEIFRQLRVRLRLEHSGGKVKRPKSAA